MLRELFDVSGLGLQYDPSHRALHTPLVVSGFSCSTRYASAPLLGASPGQLLRCEPYDCGLEHLRMLHA